VSSSEDEHATVVEEGLATVADFTEMAAELVPRTSRGRRKGRHELAIDNTGNREVAADIMATDPDNLLQFKAKPELMLTQPGTATFARLTVTPRKRFLKGPNKTIPFKVVVVTDGAQPVTTEGAFVQEQILPKAFLPALLLIAGAIALALTLWGTVLKPVVQSAATDAATDAVAAETTQLADNVDQAKRVAEQANQTAEQAKSAVSPTTGQGQGGGAPGTGSAPTGGQQSGGQPDGAGGGTTGAAAGATPFDVRLPTDVVPATSGAFSTVKYVPPAKSTFAVTDILLQNPRGDSGFIQVRRAGRVLFEYGLNNFRDMDLHFVEPPRFTSAAPLVVAVSCQNPAGKHCTPSAYFSGRMEK
jgi:hypothetical protein